jgi:hypothetical protein
LARCAGALLPLGEDVPFQKEQVKNAPRLDADGELSA